jgi:flagellar protein FliS
MLAKYARQYQQTQILTSSGAQIIVLLYDAAIQSIDSAKACIESRNVKEKGRTIGKAISIVGELNSVLDFERGGAIAASLHRLYDYILAELVIANLRNDARYLDGPLRCLLTLREGWREVAAQQQHAVGATR